MNLRNEVVENVTWKLMHWYEVVVEMLMLALIKNSRYRNQIVSSLYLDLWKLLCVKIKWISISEK